MQTNRFARQLAVLTLMCTGFLTVGIYTRSRGDYPHTVYAQTAAPGPVPNALPVPSGFHYSPGEDLEALDAQALELATDKTGDISMAAFSLTDPRLVDVLFDRAAHGVTERIYLDRGELQAECRGDAACARSPLHKLIGLAGVTIKVKHSKVLMHSKAYAVSFIGAGGTEQFLLREGSGNFSEQGLKHQDNSAIFTTDVQATLNYAIKFREMWDRPDNLTVAQALE